jgi:transposase
LLGRSDYRDRRIKADQETIERSLGGNWRQEHLHALAQEVACYDFLESQIAECDQAIMQALEQSPTLNDAPQPSTKVLRSPPRWALEQAALHQARWKIMGVDLTAIPIFGVDTVLVLPSEIGPDLARFPTSDTFVRGWV